MSADALKVFLPEDQWKEKARQQSIEEAIQTERVQRIRKSYREILSLEKSSNTENINN